MSLCRFRNIALCWACIVLGVSYCLYTPIPDGFTEPWKLQGMLAVLKAVTFISSVGEYLGYGSQLNITRAMIVAGPAAALVKSSPELEIQNVRLEGLPVRIYKPMAVREPAPALIFFHGGGWTFMSIDGYDFFASSLAKRSNIIVLSVDYRLAPEHPFPVPFNDCLKVTRHFLRESSKYGIDPNRIAVGGDSSGGNLATAVALHLSQQPETSVPKLKLQVLIYPVVQAMDFNLPSFLQNDGLGGVVSKTAMIAYWMNYLGIRPENATAYLPYFMRNAHTKLSLKQSEFGKYSSIELLPPKIREKVVASNYRASDVNNELASLIESKITNPYCAPLMAADLSQMPPAYIVNPEFDILRDEGLMYAERLLRAGVKVKIDEVQSAYHGFMLFMDSVLDIELGKQAFSNMIEYLKQEL